MSVKFITPKEAAEILGCSISAATKLFNCPDSPAKRVPYVGWRVAENDFYNYINNLSKYGE